MTTIGSLFAGYGGLDLAVESVTGGHTAWVSDIDSGACKVLAHRFPDAPNLGDITTVDWATVPRVDILGGGFPCQDVSDAGKRAGLMHGTRSGLWHHFARAIAELRPPLVVIENVRGLLTARGDTSEEYEDADHEVTRLERILHLIESKQAKATRQGKTTHAARHARDRLRILGQHKRAMVARRRAERRIVRAFGTVLGTLADLGYDAVWYGLRAADPRVGSCHGRWRIFIVATDTSGVRRRPGWATVTREAPCGRAPADLAGRGVSSLLGTPQARDGKGEGHSHRWERSASKGHVEAQVLLLPTPAVNDMGEGKTVEAWDGWTAKMKIAHGNGNGHGASLAIEAQRLLPTPTGMDYTASGGNPDGANNHCTTLTDATARRTQAWGQYADAIARWETLTRPAPPPTETGPQGNPRLNPAFSEWMMGLPTGWITDVPGITRNEALKLAGNGVVPQQAEVALRHLLCVMEVAG